MTLMSVQDMTYAIMSCNLVLSALIHFIKQVTKPAFVSCLVLQTWKDTDGHSDDVRKIIAPLPSHLSLLPCQHKHLRSHKVNSSGN